MDKQINSITQIMNIILNTDHCDNPYSKIHKLVDESLDKILDICEEVLNVIKKENQNND